MSDSAEYDARSTHVVYRVTGDLRYQETPCFCPATHAHSILDTRTDPDAHHPDCTGQHETIMGETACVLPPGLPLHRTEAGYPRCSTCDGGGCLDCTDPA